MRRRGQLLPAQPGTPPTTRPVLAPLATRATHARNCTPAPHAGAGAATGAHGAPDLAACVASLASTAAQLASQAQRLADLLAVSAGSSEGSLALLAGFEAVMATGHAPQHQMPTANKGLTLTQAETASMIGIHPRTLQRMRAAGEGPKVIRVRRKVLYRRRDVERYLEGKR